MKVWLRAELVRCHYEFQQWWNKNWCNPEPKQFITIIIIVIFSISKGFRNERWKGTQLSYVGMMTAWCAWVWCWTGYKCLPVTQKLGGMMSSIDLLGMMSFPMQFCWILLAINQPFFRYNAPILLKHNRFICITSVPCHCILFFFFCISVDLKCTNLGLSLQKVCQACARI